MPVSVEFVRGVMAAFSVFFAYMAGRSLAAVRKGRVKLPRFYAWLLRTLVCTIALGIRHTVDLVAILGWVAAAILFAAGYWDASREKKAEDLSSQIVPHE